MKAAIRLPVLVVALAAALTGCESSESVESFGGPTMGSSYSVKYVGRAGLPGREALQAETEAILAEVDRQLSTYRDDSLVSQFNQLPAGACQTMPDAVLDLVRTGEQLASESGGAFDLTLEPLLDLWGFGPQGRTQRVPSAEALTAARGRTGQQHLRIEGRQLCKDVDLQLDFNAIAAGHTVDLLAARLEELGVTSFLVDVTGELMARGRKPDDQPWRIAIEAPRDDERVAQRILSLEGLGISTSGDYRNYFEENAVRYSHTLDPKTGAPIQHKLASVTVADASALRADGLSTLLLVLGPERGMAFAEQAGVAAFFVIREGEAFVTRSTPAFEQRFAAGEQQ